MKRPTKKGIMAKLVFRYDDGLTLEYVSIEPLTAAELHALVDRYDALDPKPRQTPKYQIGDLVRGKHQGKTKRVAWRVLDTRPAPGGGEILITEHAETGRQNEWFEGDVVPFEKSADFEAKP